MLELEVSVAKSQDLSFKHSLFTELTRLGLGRFEVMARERETIYLRKMSGQSGSKPPTSIPPFGTPPRPTSGPRPELPTPLKTASR